jgi:tRNA(Arg) A34 adenosine deaminase TadA
MLSLQKWEEYPTNERYKMIGREICRWVDLAVKEANKGDHKQRIGAVIFDKSKFISSGHNYKCRSISSHHPKFRRYSTSLHAEVITVLNAKSDLKGSSIIVVRINKQEELRLAKPCDVCMTYLKYVGIKKVFYSISNYPYIEIMKI